MAAGEWRAASIDLKNLLRSQPDNLEARLALARTELEQGDYSGAARELENARTKGAPGADVDVLYVKALLGLKRYDRALEVTAGTPAAGTPSQQRQLAKARGDALLMLGRHEEALVAFDAALAVDATDIDALVGRAFAVLALEGLEPARAVLARATGARSGDPRLAITQGALYLRAREFARAESEYGEVLERLAKDDRTLLRASALAGLAEAQLALGKREAAQDSTRRLLEAAPGAPAAILLRARYLFTAGDHDEAKTLLEQLLARDAGNVGARLLLGMLNYTRGDFGQADMHLTSVLASEPGNSFARLLLANTKLRESKPREALSALGPDVAQGGPSALSIAGEASIQAGDLDAGLAFLERSVAESPEDTSLLMQLAAGYIVARRPEKAVQILERMPAGGDAAYRRGVLLLNARLRTKDIDGALREARSLVSRFPDDAVARATLGGLLGATGSLAGAREQFERAAQLQPASPAGLLNLAKLDLIEGRSEDAERRLQGALKLGPANPAVLVTFAQLEAARGRESAAVKWLEQACELDKRAAEPRLALARYQLARRNFAAAASLANEVLAFAANEPAALNILGIALAGGGRADEGVETLKRVVERDSSATAQLNLARAYVAADRPRDALAAAQASLELDPQLQPALALAAAASAASGDTAAARRYLGRLESVEPKHPVIYLLGGDLAAKEGDPAGAARLYAKGRTYRDSRTLALREHLARRQARLPDYTKPLEEWLQRSPGDLQVRMVLAQCQLESGARAQAIGSYEAVIAGDARNSTALNNLAWLYFETQDKRALSTAERAYELAPDTPEVIDTYGWIMLHEGHMQRALQLLSRAAEMSPDSADVQYHRAVALVRTGEELEARELLAKLLERDTPFAERESAERLLAGLQSENGA